MALRNVIVTAHYNGTIFNDVNIGFSFVNTTIKRFKIHVNSDLLHLKERIEQKIQLSVREIIYRLPLFNGDDGGVFYVMKPLEDNDGVRVMFDCHTVFGQLESIELYVHVVPVEADQMQESQQHQYGMSQPTDEELTQNNEPFIANEEVGEYSDDELGEIQYEDLFGDDDDTEVNPSHTPDVPPMNLYNPAVHMTNVCLEAQPVSVFSNLAPYHMGDNLELGMEFENKEVCMAFVQQWHIINCLDYWAYKSDNTRYIIKCKDKTCPFKCRAAVRKKNAKWVIAKLRGPHTCATRSMGQDHRQLTSNLVSQSIRELVNSDPSLKVKVIIAHVIEKFGYTISYRKVWIAKVKVIESLYGNWETSYNDLPQWLLIMKTYLPGTVIDLQTLPAISNEGTQLGDKRIFHRLFWAFQPCIRGFAYCKPIVQVDGTWLYGKYRGTLLMVVAQDGNGNIFPIAFAIVEGETKDAWSFFLRNLRRHVTPQANLCLISDRHASIKSAYENPENGWQQSPTTHVYCIRHIAQNFMREIKDNELRKKFINMGKNLHLNLLLIVQYFGNFF